MKKRLLLVGVVAASLVLGGCSALRVSSSDEAGSKPAGVGISDGSASQSPSPTGPIIPEGMIETTVDLGSACPVDVSLAISADWSDGEGYDGYRLYETDTDAIVTVNCLDEDDASVQELMDKAREQMFSTSGSTKVGEASGSLDGGEYWTVYGTLAPEDMRAVEDEETAMFGVVAGISVDGRLFKVSVDMLAPADDEKAVEEFRQMLPTVRLDDQELKVPDLR
ncbi:hypothetical protein [Brevibacterium atlanticum]|uniref:hypothetical protein n=1 Tax=Brevibacterium atlanticum TaxID=2697563 RepID=UPI00142492B4|nr:hypothetical protein [Brevibacterium atlanticum]